MMSGGAIERERMGEWVCEVGEGGKECTREKGREGGDDDGGDVDDFDIQEGDEGTVRLMLTMAMAILMLTLMMMFRKDIGGRCRERSFVGWMLLFVRDVCVGQRKYWTKIYYTIVPAFAWGRVPGGGGHRGRIAKLVRKRRALKDLTPEIPFLLLAAFRIFDLPGKAEKMYRCGSYH